VFNLLITNVDDNLQSHELDDFAPAFEHEQMDAACKAVEAMRLSSGRRGGFLGALN